MTAIQGFIGGDNESYSRAFGYSTCINLYPEISKDDSSTTPKALIGTPGTTAISAWNSTTGSGGGRGCYTSSRGIKFSVIGSRVYRYITKLLGPTQIYTIPDGTTPVAFSDDGWYLCIVDGNQLYCIDMYSNVGMVPTLPNGVHPTHIVYLGGRMVINASTQLAPATPGLAPVDTKLYYSQLYNSTQWLSDGAGSVAVIASADPVSAFAVVNDQIIACGSGTVEFLSVSDDANHPFVRVSGSSSANGIFAQNSLVTVGKSSYYVGYVTNGSVEIYRSNGYEIETVSTPAIEWKFATAGDNAPTDAIGFTYSQAGHTFYGITSAALNLTLVYDVDTGAWHRRTTRSDLGVENYWKYLYFSADAGNVYCQCADYEGVLQLDLLAYAEFDGRTITRERSTMIMQDELNGIVHDSFTLHMETGTGNSAGVDTKDPIAELSWSDDGNVNFSTACEMQIGNDGEGGKLLRSWRLGYARLRSYRVRITAPVRVILLDAYVNMSPTGR